MMAGSSAAADIDHLFISCNIKCCYNNNNNKRPFMHTRSVIAIVLLLACCSAPVIAATKYIDSSPAMSAAISGTNEFTPGEDATIRVIVQNSGLNTFKFVNSGTIERDDLPNTAKLVTIGLSAGTAPLTVRTDPQMVGDIKGTGTAQVNFSAKISSDAAAGEYQVPLFIQYKYLKVMDQEVSGDIQFVYNRVNETLPVTIRIKPLVKIQVLQATPDTLNVGTEGYLHVTIKNTGSDDGKKATVKISRSGQSPIIPTDSSVFIGDFPSGGVIDCRYKVSVSNNAEKQTYPIDVSVTYENNEGATVTSSPVTIGVPIGGKTDLAVISAPAQIPAGSKNVIAVQYQNNGGATIYNAQARISAVTPFSSNDNSAYLGDIRPGDSATARYEMSVNDAATPREYTLDSEVRYRDALDNSQISDMLKVRVQVLPKTIAESSLAGQLVLVLVATAIIGAGYYVLVMRKKK
jgi:hypothetical protein